MVRIPTIRDQVRGMPQLTAQRTVPFPGDAGEQIQQLGSTLANAGTALAYVGMREKAENDAARVKELDNLLSEAARTRVNQYRSLAGRGAMDAYPEFQKGLDEEFQKIAKGVENEEQRRVFEQALFQRRQDAAQSFDTHLQRERKNYQIVQSEQHAETMLQDALGSDDPVVRESAKLSAFEDIADTADLAGYPPEWVENRRREWTTRMHTATIERLLEGQQAGAAEEYLKANTGEIDALVRERLQGKVELFAVEQDSFDLAVRMENYYPTLEERLDALDKRELPIALRDKTVDRLLQREGVREATAAKLRQREQQAYQERVRVGNDTLKQATEWATLNRERLDQLPPEVRQQLRDTGMEPAYELFVANGRQWIRTERGTQALLQAAGDPATLRRFKSVGEIYGEYRFDLDDKGLGDIVDMWVKTQAADQKAALDEAKRLLPQMKADDVGREVRFALQDAGFYSRGARKAKEDAIARGQRIEHAVTMRLERQFPDGKGITSKAIREEVTKALGNTIRTAAGLDVPLDSLFDEERDTAKFVTAAGTLTLEEWNKHLGDRSLVPWVENFVEQNQRQPTEREVIAQAAAELQRQRIEAARKAREEWARNNAARKAREEWARNNPDKLSALPRVDERVWNYERRLRRGGRGRLPAPGLR